jgi:cell fate regulator YaaT (PSP1 superfamily)
MPTVVGVRLRFSKTLWFDPAGSSPAEGDRVIVETERGTELGKVVQSPHEVTDADLVAPLKPVVRVADEQDLLQADELAAKEHEAMIIFREMVEEQGLDMKAVDVEYLLDGERIVFYFSSDERVDFRQLVKDLATRFRSRIDMRQVGVRDEARAVGGVGHCGQMLCCVRFGGDFQPVSIRMAKEQDLPLNPLKISGLCGRLMCCLRYEFDAYKDFKSRAPKRGAIIDTPRGLAKVIDMSTPKEAITMRFEDGKTATVPLASMSCKKGAGCPCSVNAEAMPGTGPAEVLAAMEMPVASPKAEVARPRKEAPAESAQEADKPAGGRRRRRRKPSQGGQAPQPDAAKAQPADSGKPRQASEPKGGDAKQAPQPDKAVRPRRRRRRKPGGAGNADSQGSEG